MGWKVEYALGLSYPLQKQVTFPFLLEQKESPNITECRKQMKKIWGLIVRPTQEHWIKIFLTSSTY